MHILNSIRDLPQCDRLSVIINCGTRWVTTLALVSALKSCGAPLLLIDCESQDGSFEHFRHLSARFGFEFHWLEWPLKTHGTTLDALFLTAPASEILLIDSDVEVPDTRLLNAFRESLGNDAGAYGAGFVHGPDALDGRHGLPPGVADYAERMWIPLVLLRVEPIRRAMSHRQSFRAVKKFSEVTWSSAISWIVGQRFWLPVLRRIPPSSVPAFTQYDTGARIHAYLVSNGYRFAKVESSLWTSVLHFHGVTRAIRGGLVRRLMRGFGFSRAAQIETTNETLFATLQDRLAHHAIDVASYDLELRSGGTVL